MTRMVRRRRIERAGGRARAFKCGSQTRIIDVACGWLKTRPRAAGGGGMKDRRKETRKPHIHILTTYDGSAVRGSGWLGHCGRITHKNYGSGGDAVCLDGHSDPWLRRTRRSSVGQTSESRLQTGSVLHGLIWNQCASLSISAVLRARAVCPEAEVYSAAKYKGG